MDTGADGQVWGPGDAVDGRRPWARALAAVGVGVCAASLLAFAALQYAMPPTFTSRWGNNQAGARHFRRVLAPVAEIPVSEADFAGRFRLLLLGAWAGYALAISACLMGGTPRARWSFPAVTSLGLALAIGCPPSLSYDVYAYVAFARMPLSYGLNPYVATPKDLVPLGDQTGPIVGTCEMPSVYGPVWTQLCIAEVALLRDAGLWWQVVALKLLAAAALSLAAVAGRAVAERFYPGRGDLTLLAIGLNPLLLIEGPANGHNDVLMMAFLLWAAALFVRGRAVSGSLALGLAVGIKFLPLAAVPWVLWERCRGRPPAEAARLVLVCALLIVGPTALAYAPHWRGAETFSAQQRRSLWGGGVGPDFVEVGRWCDRAGFPRPVGQAAVFAARQWPVVDVYVALTVWLLWSRAPGRWLDAWSILAVGFVFWTMTVRYPWYLTWPLMVSLTRWGRLQSCLSLAGLAVAIWMSLDYVYAA